MFCVAVLLATAVKASPINIDEADSEIVNNEVEPEAVEADQWISDVEDAPEEINEPVDVPEETPVEEAPLDDIVEIEDLPIEDFQKAVPYDVIDEEEEPEMTQEEIEKTIGIEIPLCAQYTDDRVALHLR